MQPTAVRKLRKHLRAIERALEWQLKNQARRCGVTSSQCHVLLELAEAGEASLVELSERLRLDTSTLSRTVDGLVSAGHVTRITDPADRRYVQLGITVKGKQKAEFIDHDCDQFYLKLLSQVSRNRQGALVESVRQLAESFAKEREGERCFLDAAVPDKRKMKHRKPK